MVRKIMDTNKEGYQDTFNTRITDVPVKAMLINLEDERYSLRGHCLYFEGEYLSQEDALLTGIEKNKELSEEETELIKAVFIYIYSDPSLRDRCVIPLNKEKLKEDLSRITGIDKDKVIDELKKLERVYGFVDYSGVSGLIEVLNTNDEDRIALRLDYMYQLLKFIKFDEECIDEDGDIIEGSRKAYKCL